ncbi:natural cytotoxicity triggering receptor 3-like [Aquarana catesbeiana]|uniref:natural cytotoxicity triggering receptor 3-like n=1 Tax=Aquarana catesbeiana TaxID=8400 RepID=UPI003CC97188
MLEEETLLIILAALQGLLSQTIHVSQIPIIWAKEGSPVTIPCDYNISDKNSTSMGSYKWYRDMIKSGLEVSENNHNYSGRLSTADTDQFISKRSATIVLYSVEVEDSGMYYCEVTLQFIHAVSGYGNGTFLNVTVSSSGPPSYLVMNIIRLILGVLVFLVALSVCLFQPRCFL